MSSETTDKRYNTYRYATYTYTLTLLLAVSSSLQRMLTMLSTALVCHSDVDTKPLLL
jgi:hypothetical protein